MCKYSPHNSKAIEQQHEILSNNEITIHTEQKLNLKNLFLTSFSHLGTPINRLPIMAKSVLDLYELYLLVVARGGLVDVINKKLWQEIIKGLHLPSSITSAAFTLRTQWVLIVQIQAAAAHSSWNRNRSAKRVWQRIYAIFDLIYVFEAQFTNSHCVSWEGGTGERLIMKLCCWRPRASADV